MEKMMKKGNRRESIVAIGAVFVVAILMTAAITPAIAYDPKSCGCGDEGGAGTGNATGDLYENTKVVELKGAEANKVIAKAFSNEQVKLLREKMIQNGLTLEHDNIEAKRVTALYNDTTYEIVVVILPFSTDNKELDAAIVWIYDNGDETAKAAIKGPAKNFVDVMDVVKADRSCKEVIQNFSDQGYVIDLKNAYVVEKITLDQNIAVVGIEATHVNNTSEYILATVDLQKKAVIEVITGPKAGFWSCFLNCASATEIAACGYACYLCPSAWPYCIICALCACHAGCCVGKCCAEQGGNYYIAVCIPAITLCYTPPPDPAACCIAYGCLHEDCEPI